MERMLMNSAIWFSAGDQRNQFGQLQHRFYQFPLEVEAGLGSGNCVMDKGEHGGDISEASGFPIRSIPLLYR